MWPTDVDHYVFARDEFGSVDYDDEINTEINTFSVHPGFIQSSITSK